ncbi:hypothetical protein [Thiomonas sp. FB-6]|uniref:hypothetical protein n=1 Tax=Thiomonas sp. FB-6 TaxID=1158291 RepID=UPI0003823850|nr:hypothetical protein [Thiomonas sp. FB-6]
MALNEDVDGAMVPLGTTGVTVAVDPVVVVVVVVVVDELPPLPPPPHAANMQPRLAMSNHATVRFIAYPRPLT